MSERSLPTVPAGSDGPPPPPVQLQSSSVRMVSTLATAGALAGLAIVLVFEWANPHIEAWRAEVLSEAVTEVLGAERYETAFLEDAGFTLAPQGDTTDLDRMYVGLDRDGRPVGVAVVGAEPGFQDVIRVIFGYDPETGEIVGMKVLESKETPGLGDKIEKDSAFVAEFARVATPLLGVKSGRESGDDREVTTITGATISSKAIVDIINHRLDEVRAPIDRYWTSSASALGPAGVEGTRDGPAASSGSGGARNGPRGSPSVRPLPGGGS